MKKILRAIGSIIPHSRGAKLVSLDKNYTNTYNYAYNYAYNAQHTIITSNLELLFSRRGLSPMAIPLNKLYKIKSIFYLFFKIIKRITSFVKTVFNLI